MLAHSWQRCIDINQHLTVCACACVWRIWSIGSRLYNCIHCVTWSNHFLIRHCIILMFFIACGEKLEVHVCVCSSMVHSPVPCKHQHASWNHSIHCSVHTCVWMHVPKNCIIPWYIDCYVCAVIVFIGSQSFCLHYSSMYLLAGSQ